MHRTSRRIVFYSLVALFIVGGFYAVASVLGFTVETGGTLVRTGSLFIAPTPRNADLFLDGELVDKRPRFLSSGTLIKNLAPGTYEVRAEHEGRISWRTELPVTPGLVTRATGFFLWPRETSSTVIASRAASFSLSAGTPVIKTENGVFSFGTMRIPGEQIEYASDDSATLITRTGNTVYSVGSGPADSIINLTSLFHSLKERDLGLPGTVPLVAVRPHPFSAGKFLIITKTSLYVLDTRRISLERLVTVEHIAHTAFNESEVLLLGNDGALMVVDLIFKTVDTAPFASTTFPQLASTGDGTVVIALTADQTLLAYHRVTGEWTAVAENVSGFMLEPNGTRLAYASRNSIGLYFLARYDGDTLVPQGYTMKIWEGNGAPRTLLWSSSFSRYLFFLANGEFIAAEVGFYGEQNHTTLEKNVRSFALSGYSAYLLKENGELAILPLER